MCLYDCSSLSVVYTYGDETGSCATMCIHNLAHLVLYHAALMHLGHMRVYSYITAHFYGDVSSYLAGA